MAEDTRRIALLRGVNLGPSRRLPMAELRQALEHAGHEDVRTLLQTGNVFLTSGDAPAALEQRLEGELLDAFGVGIGVVVRTAGELAAVVAGDPFAGVADDPSRYQVSFLSTELDRDRADALERADVAPERVAVRGREIYAWHPGGVGRSELAKLLTAQRLGVQVTARNWRTVTKLLELARG